MMSTGISETDGLLGEVARGNVAAGEELLARHRRRIRQMVAVRLDRRLAARVDASDVIQETFAEAARKLPEYALRRPLPFYPWLRQIAWERLAKLHRSHVVAEMRSVGREVTHDFGDPSADLLAQRFVDTATSPSRMVMRAELLDRVRQELDRMSERDREVLVLRYLEELSVADIAAVLSITEGAVKVRHLRALDRLRRRMDEVLGEDAP